MHGQKNIKIHVLCSVTGLRKLYPFRDHVEKYYRARQAADENTAHAFCMANTSGYKHTLRICNTYCFSTATILARMSLTVTLHNTVCLVLISKIVSSRYCTFKNSYLITSVVVTSKNMNPDKSRSKGVD